MSNDDVRRLTEEFLKAYPPLITLDQAAVIAQVPIGTIYDWSSREKLDSFKSKPGRRALLDLAGFIRFLVSNNNE